MGVINPGSEPATVTPALCAADGTPLGTGLVLTIPPKSMRQLSLAALFGGVFFPDGFVTLQSTQPVYAHGSVIDYNSGDQVFIRGIEDNSGRKPLGAEASGE